MSISIRRFAANIDASPSRISELVNGQLPISADTALCLGLYFTMDPLLQAEYDARVATRELKDEMTLRFHVFHRQSA
jgi:plasmid maintenance system antidote protein VapI